MIWNPTPPNTTRREFQSKQERALKNLSSVILMILHSVKRQFCKCHEAKQARCNFQLRLRLGGCSTLPRSAMTEERLHYL
jgi:hypothetical protein